MNNSMTLKKEKKTKVKIVKKTIHITNQNNWKNKKILMMILWELKFLRNISPNNSIGLWNYSKIYNIMMKNKVLKDF